MNAVCVRLTVRARGRQSVEHYRQSIRNRLRSARKGVGRDAGRCAQGLAERTSAGSHAVPDMA